MSIRIGKISLWHVHAWDYIRQAQEHDNADIVAIWDEDSERGQRAADILNIPFYKSLDDMLALQDIDAVIVDAPTNLHRDVMVAAARAGKHIFTEKVIAPTMKDLDDIMSEVFRNQIKLTVSLPRLNEGYTLSIQEVLRQGMLGDVTYVRVRLSHDGAIADWLPEHFFIYEQCLGGALIDLGCHPMYLAKLFLDQKVTAVSASFGYVTGREVEDNAVVTLFTESEAIGVVEASFVNTRSPFIIEIHGKEGVLMYGAVDKKLLYKSIRAANQSNEWTELAVHPNRESSFQQWIHHIQNDTLAAENIQMATELTRLVEAANRSAKEKRVIWLT